jgi:hypothetical protein
MSKLSKIQIYAMRWLNGINKSSLEISDELSIPENQVIKTLEKLGTSQADKAAIQTKSSSAAQPIDLMIRHTAGKKTNNVSIMTQEASQLHDSIKQNSTFNPATQKGIFRPKSNDK